MENFFRRHYLLFLVAIFSIGFCYAYFSDKASASGGGALGSVSIKYCSTANIATETTQIKATLNGGSEINLTSSVGIAPGDEIVIKGYAVNTSSVVIYAMAKLEIVTNKGTEVIWYNIVDGNKVSLDNGVLQAGAGALDANVAQALALSYTFDGTKYNNEYTITSISLNLYAHQKDFLSSADDYNDYVAVNGYTQDSIYAAHLIMEMAE